MLLQNNALERDLHLASMGFTKDHEGTTKKNHNKSRFLANFAKGSMSFFATKRRRQITIGASHNPIRQA